MNFQMKNICSLLTKLQRQMKNGRFSFQPILLKPEISPIEKQQGWLFQTQGPEAKLEPGSAAFIWFSSSKETHFSAEECKALATRSGPGRGAWAVPFHSTLTMRWKKDIHPWTCTHVPKEYVHAHVLLSVCQATQPASLSSWVFYVIQLRQTSLSWKGSINNESFCLAETTPDSFV